MTFVSIPTGTPQHRLPFTWYSHGTSAMPFPVQVCRKEQRRVTATCHAELLKLLLECTGMCWRQLAGRDDIAQPRRRRRRRRVSKPVRWSRGRAELRRRSRRSIARPRRRRRVMRWPMTDGIQHVCRRVLLRTGERYESWNGSVWLLYGVEWSHWRMGRCDNCTVYWAILCQTLYTNSQLTEAHVHKGKCRSLCHTCKF